MQNNDDVDARCERHYRVMLLDISWCVHSETAGSNQFSFCPLAPTTPTNTTAVHFRRNDQRARSGKVFAISAAKPRILRTYLWATTANTSSMKYVIDKARTTISGARIYYRHISYEAACGVFPGFYVRVMREICSFSLFHLRSLAHNRREFMPHHQIAHIIYRHKSHRYSGGAPHSERDTILFCCMRVYM